MNTRRRAFTLVECLVVLFMMSVVMGTIVLSLQSMFTTNQRVRNALEQRQQIQRFVSQFRSDVHTAARVELGPSRDSAEVATELSLITGAGQTVLYRLQPDQIERSVQQDDAIIHRDSFTVRPAPNIGWQINEQRRAVPLVSAHLTPPGANIRGDQPTKHHLTVTAALQLVAFATRTPQG